MGKVAKAGAYAALLAVFALDLLTPLGLAAGVLYVAPVLLTLWTDRQRDTLVVMAIALVLTVVGGLAAPPVVVPMAVVMGNRLLSLGAIVAAGGLVLARRRSESRLEQERELATRLVRHALEAAPEAMMVAGQDTTILLANRQAHVIFGCSPGELVGRSMGLLLPERFRSRLAGLVSEALSLPERPQLGGGEQLFGLRSDGSEFPVEVTVSPAEEPRGGMIVAIRDVSLRQAIESRLIEAEKMSALSRLAGGIAHDFNNILTIIVTLATLVRDRSSDEEARDEAAEILEACERASALTRQLLAISRHQVISPRRVDLGALIRAMNGLLPRSLGADVEVRSSSAPDLWPVEADPGQLEQVLLNLAIHARETMPTGGILTVEASNETLGPREVEAAGGEPAPGDWVRWTVRHTGPGMEEALAARVFEPFFSLRDGGRGAGLGLAAVYGIVRQAGGHIAVDTTPEEGTSFVIRLPRLEVEPPTEPEPAPAPPVRRPHEETLLLVEDEPAVRELSARLLRFEGYQVLEAEDGEQAWKLLDQAVQIDALVTDLVMPHVGGLELATRARTRWPGMPVVMMSGHPERTVKLEGVLAGVVFLEKPYTPDELLEGVRRALDATPASARD